MIVSFNTRVFQKITDGVKTANAKKNLFGASAQIGFSAEDKIDHGWDEACHRVHKTQAKRANIEEIDQPANDVVVTDMEIHKLDVGRGNGRPRMERIGDSLAHVIVCHLIRLGQEATTIRA